MMRLAALLCLGVLVLSGCSGPNEPIRIGAVYPLTGSEDEGGVDELRGVQLAAQLVNEDGGVGGRPIRIVPIDVPAADAAPGAIGSLLGQGIELVLGSYGSTISAPAAQAAASRKMLFWETGAVGDMSDTGAGRFVFRVSPTGAVLGRSAISFVAEQLAPMLGRDATTLRFAVANVDDAYGRSVARGAVEELRDRGLQVVGTFPYDAYDLDAAGLVRRLRVLHPDVVFVSAYLQDGVAIRRQTVRQGLDLVASIGTSSSYCLPMFGERLGTDALGLFASDKPDAGLLNAGGLTPSARRLLTRASAAYEDQHEEEMEAPALSGFAAAWALFHDVLPRAATLDATGVGAAARGVRIPDGGLPNGSGLSFGAPGTADAGANLRAASVIWEWVRVGERAVVWPPSFATSEIRPIDIAP